MALDAFSPTSTTEWSFGKSAMSFRTQAIPSRSSRSVTFRDPFHHGITFHVTVAQRGIPARCMNKKVASAVRSSLLRLMNQSTLDKEHARVAYYLNVVPGPVYRLRQLAFRNLSAEQESRVRALLGMKAGDAFSSESVDGLSAKCEQEPLLKGKGIVSEIKKDPASHSVGLTLNSFN